MPDQIQLNNSAKTRVLDSDRGTELNTSRGQGHSKGKTPVTVWRRERQTAEG